MNPTLAILGAALAVLSSGADRVLFIPGSPVSISSAGEGFWLVACADPAAAFLIDRENWSFSGYPVRFIEPQGTGVFLGEPVVCDRGADLLHVGFPGISGEVPVAGGPFSMTAADWNGDGQQVMAVSLRDAGRLVLLVDGQAIQLAELPGARTVAAADTDCDGDDELLVACCGTGLHLVMNGEEGADTVVRRIGVLGEGVKSVVCLDMDEDGDPDAAGIACAEGGVCWWENPGHSGSNWSRHDIDPAISGPKAIAVFGGNILLASLFSPSMLYGPGTARSLPRGCTACAFDAGGDFVLAHRAGFVMEFDSDAAPADTDQSVH